jgi:hypothetical protein
MAASMGPGTGTTQLVASTLRLATASVVEDQVRLRGQHLVEVGGVYLAVLGRATSLAPPSRNVSRSATVVAGPALIARVGFAALGGNLGGHARELHP